MFIYSITKQKKPILKRTMKSSYGWTIYDIILDLFKKTFIIVLMLQ